MEDQKATQAPDSKAEWVTEEEDKRWSCSVRVNNFNWFTLSILLINFPREDIYSLKVALPMRSEESLMIRDPDETRDQVLEQAKSWCEKTAQNILCGNGLAMNHLLTKLGVPDQLDGPGMEATIKEFLSNPTGQSEFMRTILQGLDAIKNQIAEQSVEGK